MNARFGYIMFAAFYVTFILITLVAMAQGKPLAAIGGAIWTCLAGQSMSRCRQP